MCPEDKDLATAATVASLPPAGEAAESATAVSEVPPCIAGYRIESEIGRGGMGVVYKAVQTALGRTVALKMILEGHGQGEARMRFFSEAEAMARFQHPNIVQIYEVGEAEGRPFLSLE